MPKYGLISETDARVLEKTIDLICEDFITQEIKVLEIGVYNGATSNGVKEYIESKGRIPVITGIDNFRDGEKLVFYPSGAVLINGNSNEVYWKVEDFSQHLIIVDGCHSFSSVISDYFCYKNKVRVDGYMAFHDTGRHIKPFKDFQHGDRHNPDAYISVRKALTEIGLLDDNNHLLYESDGIALDVKCHNLGFHGAIGWELVFDEADVENEAGGFCVFKKL